MSQTTEEAAPSDDQSPPPGRPFDSDSAQAAAHEAWQSQREKVLKKHDLWESWRCVPPAEEREKPIREYLPGGSEYE